MGFLHPDTGASALQGSRAHPEGAAGCVNTVIPSTDGFQGPPDGSKDSGRCGVSFYPRPWARTEHGTPHKLSYYPKSLLYGLVPSFTWSFWALLSCHLSAAFLNQKSTTFPALHVPPSGVFSSLVLTVWYPI